MSRRSKLSCALFAALALVIGSGSLAYAQTAAPAARAGMRAARPFAEKGFELFSAGNYTASIAEFERAEAHFHAPPHLLYIARSQAALGQLVEARETYDRIIGEQLDSRAPPPFHRAQADAVAEIEQLRPRIPIARIVIRGVEPALANLLVDGRPLGAIPEVLPLNPGEHLFEADAPGMVSASVTVTVSEGESLPVELDLKPSVRDGASMLVPALVSFGVGGAALIIGSATGIASLSKASDIDEQCADIHCPSSLEEEADEAKVLGHTSTAMFIFAGLSVAAGATLLLLDDAGGGDDASAKALRLRVGPAAFWLDARF